jgi:predicted TIM-barrel fold metal-dependent hydrolase
VRLTAQPFDAPPDAAALATLLEQLGSEDMLLFATDYPHWHYEGAEALPPGLPAGLLRKMLVGNALATYPRLTAV